MNIMVTIIEATIEEDEATVRTIIINHKHSNFERGLANGHENDHKEHLLTCR